MAGVVSIPHGWGHDAERQPDARSPAEHSGVNSNLLADEELVDPLSGNAVLNGIPVTVARRLRRAAPGGAVAAAQRDPERAAPSRV